MKFQKGKSGNPGGRPKELDELTELAKKESPGALKRIVDLSKTGTEKVRLAACQYIIDRGFGKPAQAVHVGGQDGGPLQVQVTIVETTRRA